VHIQTVELGLAKGSVWSVSLVDCPVANLRRRQSNPSPGSLTAISEFSRPQGIGMNKKDSTEISHQWKGRFCRRATGS